MVFGANHPNLRRFSLRLEVPHIDRDASPEASELEASNCWGTRFQPRSRYMGAFLNLGLLLVWYGVMTLMFDVGWCGSIIWSIFDLGIFQACKITLGLNVFFIFHIFHICQVLVTRSFAAVSQAVATLLREWPAQIDWMTLRQMTSGCWTFVCHRRDIITLILFISIHHVIVFFVWTCACRNLFADI